MKFELHELHELHEFKATFGRSCPPLLVQLLRDPIFLHGAVGFEIPGRLVAEIQYLLTLSDAKKADIDAGMFAFAVNTDGDELLVDLSDETLAIYQREFDEIDTIGMTITDLLNSQKFTLTNSEN
ncbi:hypothetical protein L9G74_13785 [Shewanella sp. C32]|uniref:Uncharacterized protein n=1 Tax=Shewanella electrica TaxID=515560 RepID=A0ABT2FME9_9GAMM|nr:hypothetical protein [Shewanella electrica]MCH1926113.1 hypothetical protein [Shewanella electrica]MCS4557518.1 hypothetical protein [Shewanella electrica]